MRWKATLSAFCVSIEMTDLILADANRSEP